MPFVNASHSSFDRPLDCIQSLAEPPVLMHVSATHVSFVDGQRAPTVVHVAAVGAGEGEGVGRVHAIVRLLAHAHDMSLESMHVREQSPLT